MCNNGYYGNSMSVRAAEAYSRGLLPVSAIRAADLRPTGLTVREFKALAAANVIFAAEWHHTGKHFAATEFFDIGALADTYAADPSLLADHKTRAAGLIAEAAAAAKAVTYTDQVVEWLEWGGSRKHPVADERVATGCTVEVKGGTATVTFPNGATMSKRLTTRGFDFTAKKD